MKAILCGIGYWGKNVLKNLEKFNILDIICVEPSEQNWPDPKRHPTYSDLSDALKFEDEIKLAFVCTPISNHHVTVKALLGNGINCLVQKPLAATVEQAKELVELAQKNKLILMVAHTFLFSAAIEKLQNLVCCDFLGRLQFFHADWANLGLFSRESDVLLDLAPHPFSILKYISNQTPAFVSAVGTSHAKTNYINSTNISIGYNSDFQAYVHLNWISPKKTRQITIAGNKKMVVYDDTSSDEKLKVYDCGFSEDEKSRFSYRKGEIVIPKIEESEPIYNEIGYFLSCVEGKHRYYVSNGQFGLEVVEMIEAASKSVSKNGQPIYL